MTWIFGIESSFIPKNLWLDSLEKSLYVENKAKNNIELNDPWDLKVRVIL